MKVPTGRMEIHRLATPYGRVDDFDGEMVPSKVLDEFVYCSSLITEVEKRAQ